jgi:hypothetical protein
MTLNWSDRADHASDEDDMHKPGADSEKADLSAQACINHTSTCGGPSQSHATHVARSWDSGDVVQKFNSTVRRTSRRAQASQACEPGAKPLPRTGRNTCILNKVNEVVDWHQNKLFIPATASTAQPYSTGTGHTSDVFL